MGLHKKVTQLHNELMELRNNGVTRTLRQHLSSDYPDYYPQDPEHALEHLFNELDIKPNTMEVQQLVSLAEGDENMKWLWYEILLSAIHKGITNIDFTKELIAVTVTKQNSDTLTQPYIITEDMKTTKGKDVAPGVSFELDKIKVGQKTIKSKKKGRALEIPYETIRYSPINLIGQFFQGFGSVIIADKLATLIDVLTNGDNGRDQSDELIDESAGTIGVYSSTNGITYKDILRASVRLWRLGRPTGHMIGDENTMIDILDLDEFKKREAGVERAKLNLRGKIRVPENGYVHEDIATKKLIVISKDNCIGEFVTQGLMIEKDKDIIRQLHELAASFIVGYMILHRNARVIVNGNANFTSWPSLYDIVRPK